MLEDQLKETIRGAYRQLRDNVPGSKPRQAQLSMIAEIAKHLADIYTEADDRPEDYQAPIHIIEGPTGVGKTWGYLLPLVPLAKARKKKLVIATATISLQQQLLERDLPGVRKNSGLDFRAVIAKGRRRYLCPSRLKQALGGVDPNGTLFDDPTGNASGQPGDAKRHESLFQSLSQAFESGEWEGERDLWMQSIPEEAWSMVSTDRHGCMGRTCPHVRECPFFQARDALDEADVVVANQDLVLSDLSLGGGVVLPEPANTIYVVDECHHLPTKALQHGSSQHWVFGAREWLTSAAKKLPQAIAALPEGTQSKIHRECEIDEFLDEVIEGLKTLAEALASSGMKDLDGGRGPVTWRFEYGILPDWLRELGDQIQVPATRMAGRLEKIHSLAREAVDDGKVPTVQAEQLMPEIGFFAHRAANLAETWELLLREDPDNAPPHARWITASAKDGFIDYLVAASPISAASFLDSILWQKCAGAVVTSATVTALGEFHRFANMTGLGRNPKAEFLKLNSPFDFPNREVLEIPKLEADPGKQADHTREISQWMESAIDPDVGTLVLFSSYRQMRETRDRLPGKLRNLVLMQGEITKSGLLARHETAIEEGRGSIIFGVASMAEGVDLPGKLCEHVVIAKIPFPVPDSPIEKTTEEWLKSRGRNPFMEMMVPDAAVRLVQAAGRLIRTETDQGRVSILDTRLLTRPYGRAMLNSLPPMARKLG